MKQSTPIKTAITNVHVFNGQSLSALTTVVIEGGVITEDTHGAKFIDGENGVLLPGLIDAHIHLVDEGTLQQMSSYGITTAFDMATWPASKLAVLRDVPGTTSILSAGMPCTSAGSLHSRILPLGKDALLASPKDAERYVADRVAEGVDYIKVIADVPGPNQRVLNAVVEAAHRRGKLVVAHTASFEPFRMAQEAGVDVVTHVPRDKALDEEAVARMVASKRVAIPTLVMSESLPVKPSRRAILSFLLRPSVLLSIIKSKVKNPNRGHETYENARESVTEMYLAGVPILAGTDANTEGGSPFPIKHGESLHHELELLVAAGLSTLDALRAATSLPAEHFGLHDRGIVQVGKRADLLLIAADPIKDIRATRSIQRVWCAGIEVPIAKNLTEDLIL